MERVVAGVIGAHAQLVGVLAAVDLDDEPRVGPEEVHAEAFDHDLAERCREAVARHDVDQEAVLEP